MAAARKVRPNMTKQTAPAMRPVRTFLRARLRSIRLGFSQTGLQLDVRHHRREQQREVEEREQVEAQCGLARRLAVEAEGERDDPDAEQGGGADVERAEAAAAAEG